MPTPYWERKAANLLRLRQAQRDGERFNLKRYGVFWSSGCVLVEQ